MHHDLHHDRHAPRYPHGFCIASVVTWHECGASPVGMLVVVQADSNRGQCNTEKVTEASHRQERQQQQKNYIKNRTSRHAQAAIGYSPPAHRGGHVQNRSRRREQRRGRQRTKPGAEQPRMDGRPSRKAKARQHRLRQRQPRARSRWHTKQEPQLETSIATSCAKGGDVPVQQQGQGGTWRDKLWQPQQRYDQKEVMQATPPMHDQILNKPYRGHPGEA